MSHSHFAEVSKAICRAESLSAQGDPSAKSAWADVLRAEREIARLYGPETVVGATARVGAVAAALRSADRDAAHALAREYLCEPGLSQGRRQEIQDVVASLHDTP